jgi:hypothetical protein
VAVGPYSATALSMPGMPTMDIYCVDYMHEIRRGQEWTAHVSQLSGDLGVTRFGEAYRAQYQKAAWLTLQFASTDQTKWGGLHAAIWNLMTPDHPGWGDSQAYWYQLAEANYRNIDLRDWSVITDVNASGIVGGVQEFLTPTTVSPEPLTLTLLGSGLVGLAFTRRRRRMGLIADE